MDASNRIAPENPREKASCLSSLFFLWTFKILKDGYTKVFEVGDICRPLKPDHSSLLGDRLEAHWDAEVAKAKKNDKNPSLLLAIVKTFGKEYTFLAIIHVINEIGVQLTRPYFLGLLLSYFREDSGTTFEQAILAASGISFGYFASTLLTQHYVSKSLRIGMTVRVACVSLVYRKCLKLGRTALGDISPGQVVNLISNDVSRFDFVTITCHYMWSAPILACIIGVILYYQVGWAGLIGISAVFIVLPLLSYFGRVTSKFRRRTALKTDERVRLTDEVISGIQVIKMYAWEIPFSKLVNGARKAELDIIKKNSYIRSLYMTFNLSVVRFALFSTIFAITLSGGHLTAEKVFVIATYLGSLSQTFTGMFVRGITEISECIVSVGRIQTFLMRKEYKSQVKMSSADENIHDKGDIIKNKVYVQDVTASWKPDSSDPPTLKSFNCSFKHGTLVGVIGSIGSGKSSFLQLLLGEIEVIKGDVEVRGPISYASQEPWVFSGSVRQNILFGQEYDRKRYKQVTKVCALERDFELFPHADLTLVGERGASLSGGQKARINLARAVYKQADVYLLDDPLSAVDTHVGKQLFNDCIKGFLSSKTVILVTHQLQYINSVNHVILLDNGLIQVQGNFNELKSSGLDYAALVSRGDERKESISEDKPNEGRRLSRLISKTSTVSSLMEEGSICSDTPAPEPVAELAKSPGGSVYLDYFRAGANLCVMFFVALLFIVTQIFCSCSDYFVSYWTTADEQRFIDQKHGRQDTVLENNWLATIHVSLIASVFVVGLIRSYLAWGTSLRCSHGLHKKMFNSVLGSPISFFHTNSSGRILNRFSKDLGMIDEWLARFFIDVTQLFLSIAGSIAVTVVVNPYFIIAIVIIGALCIFVRRVYLKTSTNLKRLDGVARSPVFAYLSTTLQGLPTIRALGVQEVLRHEFDRHQDLQTGSVFLFIYTGTGFATIVEFFCLMFVSCVTFSVLHFGRNGGYGANAGLAISQAMGAAALLQWGLRFSADLANQMTSVERVLEYANLPKEEVDPDSKKKKEDIGKWPTHGKIEMIHLSLYYSKDDPPVLKDVCLEINPREKVGIVGRTGAGKSSLIQALFRMTDIEGKILIDGLDTKTLTLECLRSHVSIIPQDPVLFSGTMRRNLDPFEEYPDSTLWNALDEVELKESLKELGLQSRVMDGGSNFSLGQRQLVCLARAIVRNNKILVMDEATANVDPQTDALIQKTIRNKFSDCTVLTIAHRLNTVMDSDKVLVMDAGCVMEFDHPHNLLQNRDGYFFKLVKENGEAMTEQLSEVARKSYQKKSIIEREHL